MRTIAIGVAFALALCLVARGEVNPDHPSSVHDFTVKSIDGQDVDLSKYKGKVLMVVNVASKCGNTPQYEQMESMYEKYKDKGLVVLGFPANEFGAQEPGTNEQIKDFCQATYHVKFDMFAKMVVKGPGQSPLYKYLTDPANGFGGEISWNFAKFIIDKNGRLVGRFDPKAKPDAPEVVKLVETELAK